MQIPESTLEEIKLRTDLAELIGASGVKLIRSGSDYKACCPFHEEKTPSFMIHPSKGFYHCFGCGESGNIFTYVMKTQGLTFFEAAKKLGALCGVTIEEKEDPHARLRARLLALHAQIAAFFQRCLVKIDEAQKARDYLAARDLTSEACDKFGIGYVPLNPVALQRWADKYGFTADEMDASGILLKPRSPHESPYSRFAGRLIFSIRDRMGRVIAFSGRILTDNQKKAKYVNSPETILFRKSNVLFAYDLASRVIMNAPKREALVCEGQIDVIRCHLCGFQTAVAGLGTSFTTEHVQLLKKSADCVTLVFDGDGAGQKAALRTGGEFLAAQIPVRVATLPTGEDPDSLLRTQGAAVFQKSLDEAVSITAFQIRTMQAKEVNPQAIDAVNRISRAVLELIAQCPSAVLRASLLEEAARTLHVPVSALAFDFDKTRAEVARRARYAPAPEPEKAPPEIPVSESQLEDASSEVNNPPSPLERGLCELLSAHELDAKLEELVAQFVPDAILVHPFVRRFVAAWRTQFAGQEEAIFDLRAQLNTIERSWLDEMQKDCTRTELSELEPEQILKDFLRRLWKTAFLRRKGQLSSVSTPENDHAQLTLGDRARRVTSLPWEKATAFMVLEQLT